MEALQRLAFRLRSASSAEGLRLRFAAASSYSSKAGVGVRGWFVSVAGDTKPKLPSIVRAGDPVLHQRAREVDPNEFKSERVQNIIDDMIRVMRNAPGVGLAAPQIGIPFRIIVLEDKREYLSYSTKEEIKAQDRRPFDLLFGSVESGDPESQAKEEEQQDRPIF